MFVLVNSDEKKKCNVRAFTPMRPSVKVGGRKKNKNNAGKSEQF